MNCQKRGSIIKRGRAHDVGTGSVSTDLLQCQRMGQAIQDVYIAKLGIEVSYAIKKEMEGNCSDLTFSDKLRQ